MRILVLAAVWNANLMKQRHSCFKVFQTFKNKNKIEDDSVCKSAINVQLQKTKNEIFDFEKSKKKEISVRVVPHSNITRR